MHRKLLSWLRRLLDLVIYNWGYLIQNHSRIWRRPYRPPRPPLGLPRRK